MAEVVAPPVTRRMIGVIADGVFKVVLAAVWVAGAAPLGRLFGVSVRLLVVSGVALLIAGGVEIGLARSRPPRTYTRLMAGYDSGWALAALAGLVIAWRGGSAGGEVWVGYQTAAPVVFAALLVAATPTRATPDRSGIEKRWGEGRR
ncbi:hypothetical protein ABZ299_06560 [Streptomyces sp. NPDC006184]|uniref:hypothetical protein n=1 Tax=Streptomyces sp. NPDC006184 TaxID=3155455 RepID=UPI0033A4BC91